MQKVHRKIANGIKNWCHQTRRTIADLHDLVIFEALNIQGMTQRAQSSKENPASMSRRKGV